MEQFSANGKLLLSGEYAVLYGARSLAIPCRFGQHLKINKNKGPGIEWTSLNHLNKTWFNASFTNDIEIIESSDKQKAVYLQKLLKTSQQLSGINHSNFSAETKLDFPNSWGLGSSSTLIFLIASFYRIDPFSLFSATTTGSGYDIACAGETKPLIFYKNNEGFNRETLKLPEIFNDCYFIHLNQKQNSREAIVDFEKKKFDRQELVNSVNILTDNFSQVKSKEELQVLMDEHERVLSKVLGIAPVKDRLFSDFEGSIKSLGAWGGDFIMAIGKDVESYFKEKQFSVIFPFHKMAIG